MGIKFIKKTNEAFDPGNVVQKYSITAEVTIPDEDGGYETETCRYIPIAPDEETAKAKFREWFDKRSDYPEGSTYKILKISPVRMYPRKAEAVYAAIKNPEQAAFIIDCGSPEKASALNDAFEAIAEKVWDDDPDARATIGRDIIQYWDVGPFFTACVDPCDKAAKWCEEWLRNSDGKAPAIQGNDAGLESKSNEDRPDYYDHPLIMAITYKGSTIYCGDEDGDMWADDIEDAYVWNSFDTISTISVENFVAVAKEALETRWISEDNVEYLPAPTDADEDRRGTDRYGHSARRFTSKDLTDLDGEVIGGYGEAPDKFGLAYLNSATMDAFSNDYSTGIRDRFLHELAQMPVSKKSIEDLLRKHRLRKDGETVGIRDFFPENGIAYLGPYASDGLPYKELELKWGPALKK